MKPPEPRSLRKNLQQVSAGNGQSSAPAWNPALSGEMDLRIAADGIWYHEGTPIRRQALVKLFASVLRREADGHYYLVTPVEKWRIQVDDAPLQAVLMRTEGDGRSRVVSFQTNVGDWVAADAAHPIEVEYRHADAEPAPYLVAGDGLRAKLTRAVFVDLAELAEWCETPEPCYGVWSSGVLFRLAAAD